MCFVTFVSVANSSSREELMLIQATRFSQSCYAEQIQPKHRSKKMNKRLVYLLAADSS